MGDSTGISWTDATWNPVRGCSRVSEGCRNCYAERVAARFSGPGQPYEGLADRERKGSKWTGVVRLIPEHLADPLRWKRPRRIFVNSMSDLFHESLTNEQIAAVFGVMAAASQHTFQVLTKRACRMRKWFEWADGPLHCIQSALLTEGVSDGSKQHLIRVGADSQIPWPLPNVWLGVSVENQDAADERIPELLRTPAAVRFLSCEPLLGAVDVSRWMWPTHWHWDAKYKTPEDAIAAGAHAEKKRQALVSANAVFLDWVIAGCESGPRARDCSYEWLRSLRDQSAAARVAFFLKQAVGGRGEYTITDERPVPQVIGRVGELIPIVGIGSGSKEKGRGVIELPYLDGVQHAEFPIQ